jgi:ABC-type polar amino acid transport system ATPase subunit
MLSAQQISKSYDGLDVFGNISIDVKPGAATVLIGPSGSGKSTLLKCLAFLDEPDSGAIQFENNNYEFPTNKVQPPWPEVTVVFQQHFLWPHLTLEENITLPLLNHHSKDGINSIIDRLISTFKMQDFVKRYPNEVSVGQRQRAAIVRALALKPRYILLDEVTSSLDVEQVKNLLDHLMIMLSEGIGILIITHHLGFARAILDLSSNSTIALLDKGEIVARGGLSLMTDGTSARFSDFIQQMRLVE